MTEHIALGRVAGYLATPEKGAGPGLIVLPDRESGPQHGRDVCDRFAAEGFTALAPEGADGLRPADLAAVVDALEPHPRVRGRGLGVVGFALGAGQGLALATQRPDDVAAVVLFSGAVPAGGEPPGWSRLTAPVQVHVGEDDAAFPPPAASALEAALTEAGVAVETFAYPGAGTAFFDDSRPDEHVEDAARQAWIRVLEFLRKHLG